MPQVPLQCTSALLLIFSAAWAEEKLQQANVAAITALYFLLVLLAATQDIAVDGWALTLLSKKHVGLVAQPKCLFGPLCSPTCPPD